MRKLFTSLFFLMILSLHAQSFHRGSLVVDLNTGFEVYRTTNIYNSAIYSDTSARDLYGNGHITLGFEVGLKKRFGIGLRGKANSFFTNVDAVTHRRAEISTTDLLFLINFHPVIRKRFDLVLGADVGFSQMSIHNNDYYRTMSESNGFYYSFYLNPRFYYKRFGFNLKTYLPRVTYNQLSSGGSSGEYMISRWRGSGLGISAGIQFRFFKS